MSRVNATILLSRGGFVFISRFSLSDWENKSAFADVASKNGDTRRMRRSVSQISWTLWCVCRSSLFATNASRQRQASDWQCQCQAKHNRFGTSVHSLIVVWENISTFAHLHTRGNTMNYSVYCHTRVLSQLSVSSTTLGDNLRMLGLLRAAPGVVTYFRWKHRWVCVAQSSVASW